MVGAGATTGGTMDLANLIKPILTEGEVRLIGSTTFEECKHVEQDRALARRVQKIDVDEPNDGDTVRDPDRPALALPGPPPGRVHRRRPRGRGPHGPPPPPRLAPARQRHRRARRGRGPAQAAAARGRQPQHRREGRGARGRAHGPHPREAGGRVRPGAPADPGGGPEARGLRPGRGGATPWPRPSSARGPASGIPEHPAGCFLFTGPTGRRARPSSPSSSPATSATSSSAST